MINSLLAHRQMRPFYRPFDCDKLNEMLPCSHLCSCREYFVALNIRSAEAEALATELARLTGETKTDAVTKAVRDRLERVKRGRHRRSLADELDAIGKQCAALPVLDPRTPDEIIGYDEQGLPR